MDKVRFTALIQIGVIFLVLFSMLGIVIWRLW